MRNRGQRMNEKESDAKGERERERAGESVRWRTNESNFCIEKMAIQNPTISAKSLKYKLSPSILSFRILIYMHWTQACICVCVYVFSCNVYGFGHLNGTLTAPRFVAWHSVLPSQDCLRDKEKCATTNFIGIYFSKQQPILNARDDFTKSIWNCCEGVYR